MNKIIHSFGFILEDAIEDKEKYRNIGINNLFLELLRNGLLQKVHNLNWFYDYDSENKWHKYHIDLETECELNPDYLKQEYYAKYGVRNE